MLTCVVHPERAVSTVMQPQVCRSLAGLLLPLSPIEPAWGCQRMADLAESVTPVPAFRFAEVHVSKPGVSESHTMNSVAHHFCRSVPRYHASGGLICTSSALIIARGKLSGFEDSMHRFAANAM